jgi:SAM-dependent methyltransferase
MLGALCAMGWDCIGTETSEELAEAVRKERGVMVLTGLSEALPFEGGSFDTVTSWHSLEHMERPVRMLKEVARLLKPGGTLIVEVPNAASFQARLGGGSWFHFDAPRHLYHFKREELRDILRDLGLTVFRESTLSIEQGPYGMVQSMLNRVTFAPNVLYGLIRRTSTRREGFGTGSSRRVRAAWDLSATVFLALPAGLIGTILELGACIAGRGGVVRILAVKGPRPAGALVIDPTR